MGLLSVPVEHQREFLIGKCCDNLCIRIASDRSNNKSSTKFTSEAITLWFFFTRMLRSVVSKAFFFQINEAGKLNRLIMVQCMETS